ncbi:MAG: translation initiation factor IF-2 [Dehalococcoidia bacterium]|nr:translation initiation factor IF-2 [Dehalococcoidia bacterium]
MSPKLKYRAKPRRTGPRRRDGGRRTVTDGAPPGAKTTDEFQLVKLPSSMTVKELADVLEVGAIDIIKELMKSGVMANINQVVGYDTAAMVADSLGFEPEEEKSVAGEKAVKAPTAEALQEDDALKVPRPPVVTIMGHVDHGKTSLLDALRKTNVAAGEAGGITQHIGAYQVELHGQKITFLDTPGHEAFTAMRARGAQATDIAVLVVAADDGVMPQTKEAIDHARAAKVPIVVAINKMDKPEANPDKVKQQLADLGLVIEEWGGDVVSVPVSAKKKEGIQELLENILVVAEVLELKANPMVPASGVVVEAEMDKSRGPLATVLVQSGTLSLGDMVVIGSTSGRIKAMFGDTGKRVKKAGPAMPVEILGMSSVPVAGDTFQVIADERQAKAIAEARREQQDRRGVRADRGLSLDDLSAQIKEGKVKELNLILKTDVQGSLEPVLSSLEKLDEPVKVHFVHADTGSILESDVLLAMASEAIVIGFNARVEPGARRLADQEGVDIRMYEVIYELVDDVRKALVGMLERKLVEVVEAHAEVRQVFRLGKHGAVAGVFVRDGKISRSNSVRVLRGGEKLFESSISSLRRFKEDVREVASGFECGVGVEGFSDFKEGDVLEFFTREKDQQASRSSR